MYRAAGDHQTTPAAPTVLVVGDDDEERTDAADALETRGFAVIEATHGRQALHVVQRDRTVDLLVAALDMPDLDGITLAQLVHRIRPDLKVLLVVDRAGAKAAAAFDLACLAAPIRGEALAAEAQQLLGAELQA